MATCFAASAERRCRWATGFHELYRYMSRQGIIESCGSSSMGDYYEQEYYKILENGSIEELYLFVTVNFNDINGNGRMDEEEKREEGAGGTHYYDAQGNELDESYIKEKYGLYNSAENAGKL